jgi:hypothetical protein
MFLSVRGLLVRLYSNRVRQSSWWHLVLSDSLTDSYWVNEPEKSHVFLSQIAVEESRLSLTMSISKKSESLMSGSIIRGIETLLRLIVHVSEKRTRARSVVCFKIDTRKEGTWWPFCNRKRNIIRTFRWKNPNVVYSEVMDNSGETRDEKKTTEFWTTKGNLIPLLVWAWSLIDRERESSLSGYVTNN